MDSEMFAKRINQSRNLPANFLDYLLGY